MIFSSLLEVGLTALTRNRMRSALTVLGIVIGVAAVIATLAIGQGARAAVQAQIRALGANTLTVLPGTITAGGVRMGSGGTTTLTPEDATAIKAECPAVDLVAPTVRTGTQVVWGDQNWNTQVQGTTPEYAQIRQWPMTSGVFISDADVRGGAKVCVLGSKVVQQLYGSADPIGTLVRIKGIPFQVIGVLAFKGGTGFGGDQDDVVLMPITTEQHRLLGITYVNNISVSAVSEPAVDVAVDQITDLLRQRHRIRQGGDADFFIFTQKEVATAAESQSKVMTLLLASVAAVSLLVGGIGIMNIMLVSVTERTREIGLRMAIGARGGDVLLQFLVEAVVLSAFGGCIGIALGFALSKGLTLWMQWPTQISINAVLVSFGFAAATGVFFGFYPARKAAALDPIEALRFE